MGGAVAITRVDLTAAELRAAAGRDAVDANGAQDESACWRTAKSCGPDTPTLGVKSAKR